MIKDIEWLKEEIEEDIKSWGGGNPNYFRGASDAYENVLELINQLDEPEVLLQDWIEDNEFLVNDESGVGYTVIESRKLKGLLVPKQEREQKYYVDLDTAAYVAKWDGNDQVDIYTDGISGSDEFEFHLTEQEIKDYDPRYFAFAVKVEELEE